MNQGRIEVQKNLHFRKRPYRELGEDQQETLKRLRVTEINYDASFTSTPASSNDSFMYSSGIESEDNERVLLSSPVTPSTEN